jgi:hypothetical protein
VNLATFFLSQSKYKEMLNKYFYDPWDKYKFIFDDKNIPQNLSDKFLEFGKNMGKIAVTMNYPKNINELFANTCLLWLFSRPMELLLGSKVVAMTYLTSHLFTFLCFLPIPSNMIKNSVEMNPYAFTFSGSVALLFNFTGATRAYRFLGVLSWVPFILILVNLSHDMYETRPIFLTALLMTLYIKWKIRVY